MRMPSNARRLIVAVLALACVGLAVMWPTWRTVLAQVGGYGSSFLGCGTDGSGGFVVVLADGPEAVDLGASCAEALNSLDGCTIEAESQAIDPKRQHAGALFRYTCIP